MRFRGERFGEENLEDMKDTGDHTFRLWGGFCSLNWAFPPGVEC